MTNFFYNDEHFSELDDLLNYLEIDEDNAKLLEDDYTITVECSDYEPLVQFSADWIAERIDEERFSEENNDNEFTKIIKILNENIDFDKINKLVPMLYYISRRKHIFTKKDILEYIA